MDNKENRKLSDAYLQVIRSFNESKKLDPVDDKELDKKFKDRKDKDIDNDGDVDSSDEYLHKRRKAISKDVKEEVETVWTEESEKAQSNSVGMRRALEQVWMESADRAKHYRGATKQEGILDKESPKSKEFVDKHKVEVDDTLEKSHSDVVKAGRGVGTRAPARSNDQLKGDKTAQTPKDTTK